MNIPSTFNLSAIPNIDDLKKLCQSISTLEAIICQEWEYRYYSYQKDWDASAGEECMEMRNGSGDHFFVLFSKDGAIINGLAYESKMCNWAEAEVKSKSFIQKIFDKKQKQLKQNIWTGVVDKVPKEFQHFIFGEPIKSIGTTFCIWRKYSDSKWNKGDFLYPNDDYKDGSEDLLFILDGYPATYHQFAIGYYEDEFEFEPEKLDLSLVEHIYSHKTLTKDIVLKINPNIKEIEKLRSDLIEIGYPFEL